MGVLTGSPKGPIQLPDYNQNFIAVKQLRLKRKELELKERLAEQQLNKGKTKGPPLAKFSKTEANFQDRFHSVHDEAMDQLDQFAINNADKLNPNSDLYDIKTDRIFQNMQKSVTRAADHSNSWVTNGTDFLSYINEKDEYGNRKVDVSSLEQKPKYLNINTVQTSMDLRNEPFIFQNSFWTNDETVQQQLSLKEGGDPNNINDYLVDENGFFLSKGGGLVVELQSNGQNAQSGLFTIDDVFNQEISGDSIRFDSNGNLMYGEKMFFEHFDTGFFDKNKYQTLDKPTNFIYELAGKKLKFSNLLNQVSENKYEIDNEAIGKIRQQGIDLFSWNGQTWGNDYGDALALQVARKYVSEKYGIQESEVDQAQINAVLPMIKNNEILAEEFRSEDGGFIKSVYDQKEIKTFNDYAGELILESYANQNRFSKEKFTSNRAEIKEQLKINTNFITVEDVAQQYIEQKAGTFVGAQHAMIPIDSRTGKIMEGTWIDNNNQFKPLTAEDAKYCVIVPMFKGHFEPEDPDAIKRAISNDNADAKPSEIVTIDGVETYVPMTQMNTMSSNLKLYSKFIEKAEEVNNNGVVGKSDSPSYAEGGIVSKKNNWKLPGS